MTFLKKKQRRPKRCLLSLVELILHTFPVTPQCNQGGRNLTRRMWVLGSSACKVIFFLSDHYAMYLGAELLSEQGAHTTFL